MENSRRTLFLALTVALALMLVTGIVSTLAGSSSNGELIKNGDFENGFRAVDGCGMVGVDWGCFNTGGIGGYGFYDDQWDPVVATGHHAQLIEINTKERGGDVNRTAGIYQTIDVVPGKTYTLSFNGMMRSNDLGLGGDPWRYVMLVGFTHNGSTNWVDAQVKEVDVGPIQDRVNPDRYYKATLNVQAQGDKLTVFIAGRMKWGNWYREVDFDVDTVSLVEAPPLHATHTPTPTLSPTHVVVSPPTPTPTPMPPAKELVCDGPDMLANGGFESGFDADGTAVHWEPYNNDGRAHYGYYDDQWEPVVAEGAHAQLLEINSYDLMPTDTERWVGISQKLSGLHSGAIYQLQLKAMIREAAGHNDEDPWRYEVYWGVNDNDSAIVNVSDLEILRGIPVSGIYLRTSPGPYTSYQVTFAVPSSEIRLYLLGLKKWDQPGREVNFDFDAVSLRGCHWALVNDPPAVSTVHAKTVVSNPSSSNKVAVNKTPADSKAADSAIADAETPGQTLHAGSICTYIVQPGDYISLIAERTGATVDWLVEYNDLSNPKLLFVGQPLLTPCGGTLAANLAPAEKKSALPCLPKKHVHIVKRGETLSQIAFRYGTSVQMLRKLNHITNPRLIRPGQVIQLPKLATTSS